MRILIDILHPVHVHFFRNFYAEMTGRGHEVFFTAREKDCTVELLDRFDLPYQLISQQRTGILGLAAEFTQRTFRLIKVIRKIRPDVLTGVMGPCIVLAGKWCRIPPVVFYDVESAPTNWFVYPMAHSVCTPDCYSRVVRGLQRTYPSYQRLAYLHPKRFTPDPQRLREFGVAPNEAYVVVRFKSLKAVHEFRERDLTLQQKRELIQKLKHYGRVFISSDTALPEEFSSYRISGPVEDIHHLLAFAQMLVGQSATMVSEAAVLGVPAIFISRSRRGSIDDQQRRYGLVRQFPTERFSEMLQTIEEWFKDTSPREFGARARKRLLNEKIDLADWMVNYFDHQFNSIPGYK